MRPHNKRLLGGKIKSLYRMGFAIHWLHPKSKRPIEMKWASGARKTWDELEASYSRKGLNVGVRLGSASKIGENFLAVIDCDVKSDDSRHLQEMLKKLHELFGEDLSSAPVVASGRGNGSRHVYIRTAEPVRAQRLGQSPEKVHVLMPSATQPSRAEIAAFSKEDLAKGWRLRPAWEIALMGEGQQVVLPPSVHPDTGKEYEWASPLPDIKSLPLKEFVQERGKNSRVEPGEGLFVPSEVDLVGSSLPSRIVDQIISGEGVEDRSASLLGVANSMYKAGFKDAEILTVLTDRENFLGEVAYEHAQTNDRSRAARWIARYTLEKSKKESAAEEIFNDEVDVDDVPKLDEVKAASQLSELIDEMDWRDEIERGSVESGAKPKNTLKNVIMILQGEAGADVFKRDEFANAELYGRDAPWGSRKGAEVADIDTVRIKEFLARKWRFEPSNDRINESISKIADGNRFHPVREYLDGLEWDGVPRIDSWLKEYLNAEASEPYLSAVSRKVLVAMIKRVYEPGCKFDHVLILEGFQGKGKSTALRMLAGDSWFTDATINVGDKDAVMTMRSIWLVELGELSGMRSADVELLKEFISRTTDRIRVPYGKRTENFPRQNIFVGTTNRKEYLKDPTGNRRFWPVTVGACDFKRIALDRDQLLAEAKFAYELGEPLYLEESEMINGALAEQESRTVSDVLEETFSKWIEKETDEGGAKIDRSQFTMLDLFSDFGPFANLRPNPPEVKRASETLHKLGYERKLVRKGGKVTRVWKIREN